MTKHPLLFLTCLLPALLALRPACAQWSATIQTCTGACYDARDINAIQTFNGDTLISQYDPSSCNASRTAAQIGAGPRRIDVYADDMLVARRTFTAPATLGNVQAVCQVQLPARIRYSNGSPYPSARVFLRSHQQISDGAAGGWREGRSDANGNVLWNSYPGQLEYSLPNAAVAPARDPGESWRVVVVLNGETLATSPALTAMQPGATLGLVTVTVPAAAFGGTVTNANTGSALSGVTVAWGSNSTTTNSSGAYSFANVLCGTANLVFTRSGYQTTTISNYTPACNASSVRNVTMTLNATASFGGTVTDAGTGTPLAGVTVTWGSSTATTNSSGVYSMGFVACGTNNLVFTRSGYQTATVNNYTPVCSASSVRNAAMTPNATAIFGGTVTDAGTGAALAGVTVTWGSFTTSTNSSGAYLIGPVPCGTNNLVFAFSGYATETIRDSAPVCLSSSARNAAMRRSTLPPGEWSVIVHGLSVTDDYHSLATGEGWMRRLAERIGPVDSNVQIHTMDRTSFTIDPPMVDPMKHHVLLFDWVSTADDLADGNAYAAGDALYQFLVAHGAEAHVRMLIGYSRGAVVVSEAARRLIIDGNDARQIIFLDGEGGSIVFVDRRFDAWTPSSQTSGTRWENVFATDGAPLGGHERLRCLNLNLGDLYSHSGPNAVHKFLIDNIAWSSAGYFAYPGTLYGGTLPPLSTFSDTGEADDFPYPDRPFNGTFEWGPDLSGGIPGWQSHGGGGTGHVVSSIDNALILNASGPSRRHDWCWIRPPLDTLVFDYRVTDPELFSCDDRLKVRLTLLDGVDELIDVGPLCQIRNSPHTAIPIPSGFTGQVCTAEFLISSIDGIGSTVLIDNVAFAASGFLPAAPPVPAVSGGCDAAQLWYEALPPPGVAWYWQGTACGTDTGFQTSSPYIVLVSGTYYVRAKNLETQHWSVACTSIAVTVTPHSACPADLGAAGGVPAHDCMLDNNDFIVFINYFFTGDPRADRGQTGGIPGADSRFDNNDFVVFIDQFFAGCQ